MRRGQVISFYSFKGGVGRTMALANIACILASRRLSNGSTGRKRVLMIDFDLDSPGLHYYFYTEGLPQAEKGLVELLLDIKPLVSSPTTGRRHKLGVLRKRFDSFDWSKYYHKVPHLSQELDLYFMPHAGGDQKAYYTQLGDVDLAEMESQEPYFLSEMVKSIANHFDYVLVDSRTGLSESAMIGAMLPDKMVYVFNFNKQSIHGARPFFHWVKDERNKAAESDEIVSPFPAVFPLGSMIQDGIPRDFEDWIHSDVRGAKHFLAEMFPIDKGDARKSLEFWGNYIQKNYIPYVAQLAYGEQVLSKNPALIEDHSIVRRYFNFAHSLVTRPAPWGDTAGEVAEKVAEPQVVPGAAVQTLAEAAGHLQWWVSSTDVYERLTPKVAEKIRSFAGALAYDSLGERLLSISRHYVAIADTAANPNDHWASIWWVYAKETLENTDSALENLKNRRLPDGFSAMDNGFWTSELWSRASKFIWTTNVSGVGQSFGRKLNPSAIASQGEAVRRGVSVTRVFVLEDFETSESRIELRKIIEAQIKAKITVYVINRAAFDIAKGNIEDALGSEDFMVVDHQFVYVTERKKIDARSGASTPTRIQLVNSRGEIRRADAARAQIQDAATPVVSIEDIPALIPADDPEGKRS